MDEDSAEGTKTATEPTAKSPRGRRQCKAQGELAELAFMHKAASLGFGVAKPYGDNRRYDFILEADGRLSRVQVKSTNARARRGYTLSACWTTTGKRIPYTAEQIDFVVAYVGQEDAWYVIPLHAFAPRRHLQLYPSGGSGRGNTKYEKFREAWHLMKADQRGPARDS